MRQTVIEDGVLLFQDDILVFDVAKTVDYGLDFFVHVANAVSLEMRTTQLASANVALIFYTMQTTTRSNGHHIGTGAIIS